MTQFLESTVSDIRGGRQSWRVILMMSLPAFLAAVVLAQLHF